MNNNMEQKLREATDMLKAIVSSRKALGDDLYSPNTRLVHLAPGAKPIVIFDRSRK